MSKYLRSQAERHNVQHVYSGGTHIFETDGSTDKHTVIIKTSCDCRFMGVQGIANSMICSHVLAVIRKIYLDGGIIHEKRGDSGIQTGVVEPKKEDAIRTGQD